MDEAELWHPFVVIALCGAHAHSQKTGNFCWQKEVYRKKEPNSRNFRAMRSLLTDQFVLTFIRMTSGLRNVFRVGINCFTRIKVGARVAFSTCGGDGKKCAVFLLTETFMVIYNAAPEALRLQAKFHIKFCQFGQWNYVMFAYDISRRTK